MTARQRRFLQSESFIYVLYIVAFALFIQGLRGLAGPTTAVRGNRIAAVGMAIAVIATLLNPQRGQLGADRARRRARHRRRRAGGAQGEDDRDAADGGAVQRRRRRRRGADLVGRVPPLRLDLRLAHATVGTLRRRHHPHGIVSRRRRADLRRDLLACSPRSSARSPSGARTSPSASSRKSSPGGRSRSAPRQQVVNLVLLVLALAAGVDLVAGAHSEAAVHRHARRARRCSATPSCCRSAAPTCPS